MNDSSHNPELIGTRHNVFPLPYEASSPEPFYATVKLGHYFINLNLAFAVKVLDLRREGLMIR
jgi:hypothetical protein